jgi:hypothetical protein
MSIPTESHEFIMPLLPAYELNLLEEEDRDEVESHVRKCNECFENLYHFSPVSEGLRFHQDKIRKREKRAPRANWQWLMTLMMAFLLVISFWIIRQSSNIQKEVMRGAGQIQLLEPANGSEVKIPVVFRWEEEPEAEYYKIYIFRKAEMTVQGESVNIPVYRWNNTSADAGTYQWKVESYFINGTRIRDSITNEFHLKK